MNQRQKLVLLSLNDLHAMPDSALRNRLARRVGWKRRKVTPEQSAKYGCPMSSKAWFRPDGSAWKDWDDYDCPDFPKDLNACQVIIDGLNDTRLSIFCNTLQLMQFKKPLILLTNFEQTTAYLAVKASARERTIALLVTLQSA